MRLIAIHNDLARHSLRGPSVPFHVSQQKLLGLFALVFLVFAMAFPSSAQINGAGSISGVVTDPSSAVIPGSTVEATNVATGVKTSRLTTSAGFYVVSPLPAGLYTITIAAKGFQTLIQENVHIDAESTVGFNATLSVGTSVEQVVVTSAPPALNTTDASMAYTIHNEVYEALPVGMGVGTGNNGRDPLHFVTLLPGVSGYSGFSGGTIMGLPLGSGSSGHAEEPYLEGIPLSNAVLQGEVRPLQIGMSIEAVDQFQLEGAGASPQFYGQGATNMTLKSGTNQFHGSVYDYFRNTVLDARGYFATVRPPEKRNEFGGSVGGPIKRDKLFFFGSYNAFRMRVASTPSFFSVPTAAERAGDFSGLPVTIYDPLTTNCTSGGVCTRQPFPGNVIPASRISSISNYLQNNGSPNPLPLPENGSLQSNYLSSNPENFNTWATTDKVDWNLNNAHRFYFMFSRGAQDNVAPGPYSLATLPYPYGDGREIDTIGTMVQVRDTWVVTPSLLNQASLGFSRLWVPIKNVTINGNWMNKAGATGLPVGEASEAFPVLSFSGPNSPTSWRGANSPAFDQAMNNTTLLDNLSWVHGKHSIVYGAQIQWLAENVTNNTSGSTASWAYSNNQTAGFGSTGTLLTSTGNAYASYLLGAVSSNTIADYAVTEAAPRFHNYSTWIQDTYKVSPRLSLNLGLRYDYRTPWMDLHNHMSWLNPTTPNAEVDGYPGTLEFAGYGPDSCQCRTNFLGYYRAFGPRAGFAYGVSNKTVLRAAYMMTYSQNDDENMNSGTGLLGFEASPTFSSPDTYTPAYYWQNGVPSYQKAPFYEPTLNTGYNTTTGATGGAITYGNPKLAARPPRFQNWNIGVQRAFTPTLTGEVSYVGSNAHGLNGNSGAGLAGPAIGTWSDQMNPAYLVLGNLLNATATPTNVATAQAIVPGIALPYANFSGTISQMLRTFPQYSSITVPWTNVGNANYNSLQFVLTKAMSHGLVVNANFVWNKAMTDTTTLRSGYVDQRTQVPNPAKVLNVIVTYQSPFGKDKQFSGGGPIVQAIASHWQISGITTYNSGTIFGAIGASCNLPNAGTCYASFNPSFSGPVRINGKYGSGALVGGTTVPYLNVNAFISPAAYTYGNTPPVGVDGLHAPATYNQDLNLRREFELPKHLVFRFQADAFNVFNLVNFSAPNISITSANFGKITGQANAPRTLQLVARLVF